MKAVLIVLLFCVVLGAVIAIAARAKYVGSAQYELDQRKEEFDRGREDMRRGSEMLRRRLGE